jgi:hypothetical protein
VILRVVLALVFVRPSFAIAQDRKQAQATRVDASAVRLDGRLDDPAWRGAISDGRFLSEGTTEGAHVPGVATGLSKTSSWLPVR